MSKPDTTDPLMDEATEITKEIQNVIDEGRFPFQQVRLLVWEAMRKQKMAGYDEGCGVLERGGHVKD